MEIHLSEYGMIFVLIALCILFSILTLKKESASGAASVTSVVELVSEKLGEDAPILVAGAARNETGEFAAKVANALEAAGFTTVESAIGTPRDLRLAAEKMAGEGKAPQFLIVAGEVAGWTVVEVLPSDFPGIEVIVPTEKWTSNFLKRSNLLAIVDRIVVIAVLAIGMTLVILTGGIDLSVGSLLALSAVIGTLVMKAMGGLEAGALAVWAGFAAGVVSCGLIGVFGGALVAWFRVAPFITTLAIMMVARGFAFVLTGGFSVYQVPESLVWLGQGNSFGVPNTVIVLVVLYIVAHLFMSHTRFGRYIYAVGGNEEAARLSGVPVKTVLVFVYMIAGITAGFGGCIQASQLNSGVPNLGMMFELYVIAAVVVGGTSLSGGSGKIFGTLIGAFIISVIQNGMNLLGFDSYTQQIVLGAVILVAVLLDKFRGSMRVRG